MSKVNKYGLEEIIPSRDGIDHINVYSKSQSLLGRDLSNFASKPIQIPRYGLFTSIEGFWYWLRCYLVGYTWTTEQKERLKSLRGLAGYKAKKVGKELLAVLVADDWADFPEDVFRETIIEAIRIKITSYTYLQRGLLNTSVPLTHYYYYGEPDNAKVVDAGHGWVIEGIESIRRDLFISESGCFIYLLYKDIDPPSEISIWVDSTPTRFENIDWFRNTIADLSKRKKVSKKLYTSLSLEIQERLGIDEKKAKNFLEAHMVTTINTKVNVKPFLSLSIKQINGFPVHNDKY